MEQVFIVKHTKGALGLRLFGFGPHLKPTKGLFKLQQFLDRNAFGLRIEKLMILKNVLLIVTLLLVSGLVMNPWVLEEPYQMGFIEAFYGI